MKKRLLVSLLITVLLFATGCGSKKDSQPEAPKEETQKEEQKEEEAEEAKDESKEESSEEKKDGESAVASGDETVEEEEVVEDWMVPIYADSLVDGTYPLKVASSSSMFKIEEAELTVANGEMTAVMTMGGKGYRHLFMGTGEEAAAASEDQYIPYEENADGAHTFTVPVEALDMGIDCSAFSNKKEKWYERTLVFRSDSLPLEAFDESLVTTPVSLGLEDGTYTAEVTLGGGSGRTTVESPCEITISGDSCTATIVWSSPNYDYMIVDGEKYLPVNSEGNSTFEIPVKAFDRPLAVIGDTIAMSEPHEIEYTLTFDGGSVK